MNPKNLSDRMIDRCISRLKVLSEKLDDELQEVCEAKVVTDDEIDSGDPEIEEEEEEYMRDYMSRLCECEERLWRKIDRAGILLVELAAERDRRDALSNHARLAEAVMRGELSV